MVSKIPVRFRSFVTSGYFFNLKKSDGLIEKFKNTINNGNTFYKSLVGMDKIEMQRTKLITLKDKMITAKDNLEISDGLLKKTQYDIKRVDGEISRTDRIKHYEKFAELIKKESELKSKENENLVAVKTNQYKRDTLQAKIDSTKTDILMLEKDHTTYHRWLKYFFLFVSLLTSTYYMRDNKQILSSLEDLKRMNRSSGFDFAKLYGNISNGFWWGCQKTYGGLKCIANVSWNSSKWVATEGADKTVMVTKLGYGYISWAACSGYNQVKRLIYGDRK